MFVLMLPSVWKRSRAPTPPPLSSRSLSPGAHSALRLERCVGSPGIPHALGLDPGDPPGAGGTGPFMPPYELVLVMVLLCPSAGGNSTLPPPALALDEELGWWYM